MDLFYSCGYYTCRGVEADIQESLLRELVQWTDERKGYKDDCSKNKKLFRIERENVEKPSL